MKKFKIIEHSKSAIIYTNVEAKTKEQAQENFNEEYNN